MEEIVKQAIQVLARIAEGCAGVVIGYAIVRAAVTFVVDAMRVRSDAVPAESIRLNLGRGLALGLEFLLAADVLNTAIAPTWDQVALLAAIAAIRTFLNYFLQKELERTVELRQKQRAPGATLPPA